MPCQYVSSPTVDEWKAKLGFVCDYELGNRIGVQKSTIAIWRKRKQYPKYIYLLLSLIEKEQNGKR